MDFTPSLALRCTLAGAGVMLGSACATVLHGTSQTVPVASNPPGAAVIADGVRRGFAPMTLELSRKQTHIVTLELAGFETQSVTFVRSISGAVAGNVALGGLVGWGIDATDGAQYKLTPEAVNVSLRPAAPVRAKPAGIDLFAAMQKLDDLRRRGILTDAEYEQRKQSALLKSGGG